jgi:hypothetical protein
MFLTLIRCDWKVIWKQMLIRYEAAVGVGGHPWSGCMVALWVGTHGHEVGRAEGWTVRMGGLASGLWQLDG